MSKSVKKAIFKEGSGKCRKHLRRYIRHSQNSFLRSNLNSIAEGDKVIPASKTIVNDWDYSDYKFDYEHCKNPWIRNYLDDETYNELKKKCTRK